jgi:pyridoxal phosphate enzyme (YggS family)
MRPYENAWQGARQRIADAARAAGRRPEDVALLAVSKTFSASAVRAVHALGQREFGENYVQEAAAKRAELGDAPGLSFVLVGPLQSNKARLAAETFDRVETVDRMKIAERLAASRPRGSPPLEVLVQVNVSGEVTKSGVSPDAAVLLARDVATLPTLRLRGFMGIPEPTPDVARQRERFAVLRRIFDAARAEGLDLDLLSMGMSADMEAAIAEGATEVRIGTAIFGERERSH